MIAKTVKYSGYKLFHAISCDNDLTTINFSFFLIIRWKQHRFSMDYHAFTLKRFSSALMVSLLDQISSELLGVYRIRTSAPSPSDQN